MREFYLKNTLCSPHYSGLSALACGAFLFLDAFKVRYKITAGMYYSGQPDFDEKLAFIKKYLDKL